MQIWMDGRPAEPARVFFYKWKFGKRRPDSVAYEMEVDRADFLTRIGPLYDQWVRELRRDDMKAGHFQPPYEGATDYPDLSDLLELKPEQAFQLLTLLDVDIIGAYVEEDDETSVDRWVIVTLDGIDMGPDRIRLRGRALPPRPHLNWLVHRPATTT